MITPDAKCNGNPMYDEMDGLHKEIRRLRNLIIQIGDVINCDAGGPEQVCVDAWKIIDAEIKPLNAADALAAVNELDQEKYNVVVRQCCDLIDEKRTLEEDIKQARATTKNYPIAMDEILKLKNAICEVMYYMQHMDPTQNINGHISYMHNLLSISLAPNTQPGMGEEVTP